MTGMSKTGLLSYIVKLYTSIEEATDNRTLESCVDLIKTTLKKMRSRRRKAESYMETDWASAFLADS
eukprot:scaffold171400_cov17-Prasinocladus_malaysianus.AAC.1